MYLRFLVVLFAGASFVFAQTAETKRDKVVSATPLSLGQSIALWSITDLQFSPDGQRLAFTVSRIPRDSPREQEIWMLNLQSRKAWRFAHATKDVMAGVDDLIARGIADPNRLGIAGWSYGGYMSARAITQTRRFQAAVVGAGISDLASEFGTESLEPG